MTISGFFQILPWVAALMLTVACFIGLWWIRRETLQRGAADERNDQQKETLDDVEKAAAARDRLRRDSDYARSVRDEFTRDP